jgi:SNF2 family DNA or RNA helicase
MLDVVEAYVQSMGYSYLRMDGTTPIKQVGSRMERHVLP